MNRSWESYNIEEDRLNNNNGRLVKDEIKLLKKEQLISRRQIDVLMKEVGRLKHQNRILINHLGINENVLGEPK